MDIRRGMEEAIAAVVAVLAKLARPCAGPVAIAHVAAISANNDRSIGELIARAIDRVGRDGAVSIEDGSGLDSLLEVTEGLQFDRGFLSPYFVNDGERHSARLDDAALLVVDGRLTTLKELLPVLEDVVKERRPLLVVAEDIDDEALAALVINTVQGTLRACAVRAPGFGDQRRALLQDIAVLTGAQLVSAERGLPPHQTRLSHLGRVRKAEVTRSDTTLVGGAGSAEAIAERVASLKAERAHAQREHEREALDSRIARLCGGVAVIKVGAATETELKERKIRVEDALHATRAAIAEGVVPGGGVALVRARRVLQGLAAPSLDHDAGIRIVERALEEPLRRLVQNAGEEPSVVLDQVRHADSPSYGYNAATRTFGDLLQMGVIDPAKVTRLGLQNAGSIAALVLTTDCVVAGAAALQPPAGAVA
jgi:chaperonin GroEL